MSSSSEALVSIVQQVKTTTYVTTSLVGLIVYELLITFDQEVSAVWQKKITATSLLLLSTRWIMLLNSILTCIGVGPSWFACLCCRTRLSASRGVQVQANRHSRTVDILSDHRVDILILRTASIRPVAGIKTEVRIASRSSLAWLSASRDEHLRLGAYNDRLRGAARNASMWGFYQYSGRPEPKCYFSQGAALSPRMRWSWC
ncbi:hypothetical protein PsYK624_154900 [Phanerochaete sordida]|uniref:DUF6533 domain-containing protein n=1 Tax=Phanerochaete sordida TaxID=48140 RepID=A0A9P3GT78_9APHY|nr:hypothetical protein PsYK624_154900 [Phanerochaete sordida]